MVEFEENLTKVAFILCLVGALNQGLVGIGYALNAEKSLDFIDYLFIDLIGVIFFADMFYTIVFLSALYLLWHCLCLRCKKNKNRKKV